MPSSFTVTCGKLYVSNSWVREGLAEFLATLVFGVLLYSAATQQYLLGWNAVSVFILNVMAGLSLSMAIYVAGNLSGSYVNPGIALMFSLRGKLSWKKYPMYVIVELLGMYLGCAIVYLIYMDDLNKMESTTIVNIQNSTASLFASFPPKAETGKASLFFEVAFAHFLLVLITQAVVDPNNLAVASGLAPIPIGISVIVICAGFGTNSGCPINPAKDFSARLLLVSAGYGSETFSYGHYWFYVPLVACICGSFVATVIYQAFVGLQLQAPKMFHAPDMEFNKINHQDDAISD